MASKEKKHKMGIAQLPLQVKKQKLSITIASDYTIRTLALTTSSNM